MPTWSSQKSASNDIYITFHFWHCSILYYIILIQDSESPPKSASDDIYITLFPFLALLHPVLCNANARFQISSTISFCLYIYYPICIFGTNSWNADGDLESLQKLASDDICITSCLFLAPILYFVMLRWDLESPQKSGSDDIYITPFLFFLALLHPVLCNSDAKFPLKNWLLIIYISPDFILGTDPSHIM